MNIEYLQQCIIPIDQIKVIGKDVQIEGRYYHIIGMAQLGEEVRLYILGEQEEDCNLGQRKKLSRRQQMKRDFTRTSNPFFDMKELQIGSQWVQFSGGSSGSIEMDFNMDKVLILADFMKAGWCLPKGSIFLNYSFKSLVLTEMEISSPLQKLPDLSGRAIMAKYRPTSQRYLLEKTMTLEVGKKKSFKLKLEEDKVCQCYINQVHINDLRVEYEERFKDPRYLDHMTQEELEDMKQTFFNSLERHCPVGMGYIFIEYECSEPIRLDFYSKEELRSQKNKKVRKQDGEGIIGEASSFGIIAKSDEPVGPHGLNQSVAVIQMPVSMDTTTIKSEIFSYQVIVPEQIKELELIDEEEIMNQRKVEMKDFSFLPSQGHTDQEIIKKYDL